ncbi:MAG: hypothetical protein ACRCUE_19950 [Bosea sp. (in: a-proteobacteria)]
MFQTSYERPRKAVRVSLIMTGKAATEGNLMILQDETVVKALNGTDQFLIFETDRRERRFIAKSAIESVSEVEVLHSGQAKQEDSRLAGRFASLDPHVLLGIPEDASPEMAREAYHTLARDFHSDRLASLGLHRELTAYADEVLKRVNMAHSSLQRAARAAA